MTVTRENAGEKAIMIIEIDSHQCDGRPSLKSLEFLIYIMSTFSAKRGDCMFYTIEELVQQADRDYQGNIAELMIATETELTGRERLKF